MDICVPKWIHVTDKWTYSYIMYDEYFPVIRNILKPNTLQLNVKLSSSPHHCT